MAIIGIIAAIAVPGLLRARIAGNEASAIGSLRAINSANLNWMTNCAGGRGYATTLADLGSAADRRRPAVHQPGPLGDAGTITKSGYNITYAAVGTQATGLTTCSTVTTASQGYDALASPSTANVTGVRTFGTNEGAALFEDVDGSAAVAFAVFPAAPRRTARRSSKTGGRSADNTHGMFAIRTESLTKDFSIGFWRPRPYRALDGLNLEVATGETFGFLGPNGAGKTTTLKLLMQLIYPDIRPR